jgi:hypothetical protein
VSLNQVFAGNPSVSVSATGWTNLDQWTVQKLNASGSESITLEIVVDSQAMISSGNYIGQEVRFTSSTGNNTGDSATIETPGFGPTSIPDFPPTIGNSLWWTLSFQALLPIFADFTDAYHRIIGFLRFADPVWTGIRAIDPTTGAGSQQVKLFTEVT